MNQKQSSYRPSRRETVLAAARPVSWALVLATAALLNGCGTPKPPKKLPQHAWIARKAKSGRIAVPPEGKALVNIHRPGFIYSTFAYSVFDDTGAFVADVPIMAQAQHVCQPGERVFMGWMLNGPVSVVRTTLAAGKVYDLWIEEGMNTRPRLMPVTRSSNLQTNLPAWEAAEDPVELLRIEQVRASEAKVQGRIADIKRDFLGGSKSARVRNLAEDDYR